jgi:amino acid adenylation domain-containing protein/thioester reductase-like protein
MIASNSLSASPRRFDLVNLGSEHIDHIVGRIPGGVDNVKDIYPLTTAQEGMVIHTLLDNKQPSSNIISVLVSADSRYELDNLSDALSEVIKRHEMLRACILWEGLPRAVQVIQCRADLHIEDFCLPNSDTQRSELEARVRMPEARINLSVAPLLRIEISTEPIGRTWYAIVRIHHCVCDHDSLRTVFQEVSQILAGNGASLKPPGSTRDKVIKIARKSDCVEGARFFAALLSDVDVPSDPFKASNSVAPQLNSATSIIEAPRSRTIRKVCRQLRVSPAAFFHAAWGLAVCNATSRRDVVFGTVLALHTAEKDDVQHPIGLFINTLPFRLILDERDSAELIQWTSLALIDLLTHSGFSLAAALKEGSIDGDELFSSILNYYQDSFEPIQSSFLFGSLKVEDIESWTTYSMAVSVEAAADVFTLRIDTTSTLGPTSAMRFLSKAIELLVTALENGTKTPASIMSFVSAQERSYLISVLNNTERSCPYELSVHELFESYARRQPALIAVIEGSTQLTYREVDEEANHIAQLLTRYGVQLGEPVSLILDRSASLIVAQLAILKCGATYVPIDPRLPPTRAAEIIRDCRTKLVLARHSRPEWADNSIQWLDLRANPERTASDARFTTCGSAGIQPAYIMYTSGSTGMPKGVVIPHRAIIRLVINNGYTDISQVDRIAFISNPAFDAATFEIWGALLNGAAVVVVSQDDLLDPSSFARALLDNEISAIFITSGLFSRYATEAIAPAFSRLRYLLTGGDIVDPSAAARLLEFGHPKHLLNAYGPTECTTFALTMEIESPPDTATPLPIGKPISNTTAYVLNDNMNLVAQGGIGELCIGGLGVSLGYLNMPALTAERFVPDPFSAVCGARLYRTGDFARWRADGIMEFIGRNDQQVKLRGYRIELAEIAVYLATHPAIREAVVVVREDSPGMKRLVGYFTKHGAEAPSEATLKAHLSAVLPPYKVPSELVVLEELPLTMNGKLDRRALPVPNSHSPLADVSTPMNDVETGVAEIWQELLHRPINKTDSFFELGGHSLTALTAVSKVNDRFGCSIRIADLYQTDTVCAIAALIEGKRTPIGYVDITKEGQLRIPTPGFASFPVVNNDLVLLTGATGFVGRFVLQELLLTTSRRIYVFAQASSDLATLHRVRFQLQHWDMWKDSFESRIIPVAGNLRIAGLGIDANHFARIANEVSEIYHCATSMNHLQSYESAKPVNVDSVHELLNLSRTRRPKLLNYISTLSVFSDSTPRDSELLSELSPVDRELHLSSDGYGASKCVGEQLIHNAVKTGMACNIFRLGLVWADSSQGRYDDRQREHRLIKSCLQSGYGIRNYGYDIAPVPVDYVAKSVVALATAHPQGGEVFHISSMNQGFKELFERSNQCDITRLQLISYREWIHEMRSLFYAGKTLPILPLIEHLFCLSAVELNGYLGRVSQVLPQIDSSRTIAKLRSLGVGGPPVLDDSSVCSVITDMLIRDSDLQTRRHSSNADRSEISM